MGCAGSTPIFEEEGGFPWHAIELEANMRLGAGEDDDNVSVVGQKVRVISYQQKGDTTTPVGEIMGHTLEIYAPATIKTVIAFDKVVLQDKPNVQRLDVSETPYSSHKGATIETLHCHRDTIVRRKGLEKDAHQVANRINHSRAELVAMARVCATRATGHRGFANGDIQPKVDSLTELASEAGKVWRTAGMHTENKETDTRARLREERRATQFVS